MKKIQNILAILIFSFLFLGNFATYSSVQACDSPGQCFNNKVCECVANCGAPDDQKVLTPTGGDCGSADLGGVARPPGVWDYDLKAIGGGGSIGLLAFFSVLIRIITIGAGLWTVGNFALAGIRFLAAFGEAKVYTEVRDSLTWSIVGLVIIAAAYLLAGVIGLMFFGDASFLLNPQLQGALSSPTP